MITQMSCEPVGIIIATDNGGAMDSFDIKAELEELEETCDRCGIKYDLI